MAASTALIILPLIRIFIFLLPIIEAGPRRLHAAFAYCETPYGARISYWKNSCYSTARQHGRRTSQWEKMVQAMKNALTIITVSA